MIDLFTIQRGGAPLIVNVPHAGTYLPDAIGSEMTAAGRAVPDTDWHVEKLYDFVPAFGATLMAATHSRYVVDLNRDPSGVALYQNASNTEICPTTTFHDAPIYLEGRAPTVDAVNVRQEKYFHPYHAALQTEIERIQRIHGYAILLDGHSIVSKAPRFFAGRLPDLNLGTVDGASCGKEIETLALERLSSHFSFKTVVNARFKGGYITRQYGRPDDNIHALQLEMAQSAYMDETNPTQYDKLHAAPLIAVLQELASELITLKIGSALN